MQYLCITSMLIDVAVLDDFYQQYATFLLLAITGHCIYVTYIFSRLFCCVILLAQWKCCRAVQWMLYSMVFGTVKGKFDEDRWTKTVLHTHDAFLIYNLHLLLSLVCMYRQSKLDTVYSQLKNLKHNKLVISCWQWRDVVLVVVKMSVETADWWTDLYSMSPYVTFNVGGRLDGFLEKGSL